MGHGEKSGGADQRCSDSDGRGDRSSGVGSRRAPVSTCSRAEASTNTTACNDYVFPYLAARHARLGVDVVALPLSDWRGIDPIHTLMAAVRAIEGGFSIVRSTRMGLSGVIDPWGRIRGWLSSNESDERLLVTALPTSRVSTLCASGAGRRYCRASASCEPPERRYSKEIREQASGDTP
jgi:hypothetical protein